MSMFLQKYEGYLAGVMQWQDLDAVWEAVLQKPENWYVYAVGEDVPTATVDSASLQHFITEMDTLLHQEHAHDYCGIVYVDDPAAPEFIKIYDPNNLGVVCGFSDSPPLPGWIMSRSEPVDLPQAFPPVASRRRWWQKIFN